MRSAVAADQPIMLATTGYGIPASSRRVTAVCLRSWNRHFSGFAPSLRFAAQNRASTFFGSLPSFLPIANQSGRGGTDLRRRSPEDLEYYAKNGIWPEQRGRLHYSMEDGKLFVDWRRGPEEED